MFVCSYVCVSICACVSIVAHLWRLSFKAVMNVDMSSVATKSGELNNTLY